MNISYRLIRIEIIVKHPNDYSVLMVGTLINTRVASRESFDHQVHTMRDSAHHFSSVILDISCSFSSLDRITASLLTPLSSLSVVSFENKRYRKLENTSLRSNVGLRFVKLLRRVKKKFQNPENRR